MKVDFNKLKIGDKFFNNHRDHIGVVLSITENYVTYKWDGPNDSWIQVPCKTTRERFEINARSWHELSSLEQELL